MSYAVRRIYWIESLLIYTTYTIEGVPPNNVKNLLHNVRKQANFGVVHEGKNTNNEHTSYEVPRISLTLRFL